MLEIADTSSEKENWLGELNDRLSELHSLPKGWDGYGGVPTTDSCLEFTKSILKRIYVQDLRAPYLFPGSDGSIQIEWHMEGLELEIHVLNDNRAFASRFERDTKEIIEIEVTDDFRQLDQWLSELSDSDRLH